MAIVDDTSHAAEPCGVFSFAYNHAIVRYELPYEEMPESEHLLDLCECIQELRRDGKTKDEVCMNESTQI